MAGQDDILDGLEERLQNHAKAFESLLALTPAQEYYGTSIVDGKDPSEQWRAKKQSKEEKRAARKAKLDPANQKSALDVMQDREKKRKRELGMEEEESNDADTKEEQALNSKKIKVDKDPIAAEERRRDKADKRKEKRERKKEKAEKLKARNEAKQAREDDKQETSRPTASSRKNLSKNDDQHDEPDNVPDLDKVDISGMADVDDDGIIPSEVRADSASSAPSSPGAESPAFDMSANHSTASSSSSILPPAFSEELKQRLQGNEESQSNQEAVQAPAKPDLNITLPHSILSSTKRIADTSSGTSSPKPQLPNIDQAILQERLRTRIEELRARRKADGPDGRPAKSRQELLDQRRKKEDQRKAHKKELRRKAKEEEAQKQEARLRGSGSPLSGGDIFSPRSETNNFGFSRLAFADGAATDSSISKLVDAPKRKGPQDVKTALLAAENKQKRLSGFDAQKRADIDEKDLWLNAKKRAHGERVRDDTSLLKKALKRKEKQKSKSEKEWKEREQAVVKGKEMKQKKREDNLAKRREEKGGKKGKGSKNGGKKARPGFEGRFRA